MDIKTKYNIGDTLYIKNNHKCVAEVSMVYVTQPVRNLNYNVFYTCRVYYYTDKNCYKIEEFLEDELCTELPKKGILDLNFGDSYFVVKSNGVITKKVAGYETYDDLECVNLGNAFLTEDDAIKEVNRRRMHHELKLHNNNYQYQPCEANYSISYNPETKSIRTFITLTSYDPNVIYFATKEDALKAVDEIGEDLLLSHYFGVTKDGELNEN